MNDVEEIAKNILMYVPHELRTPLVSISGFSQLLTENYYSLSGDEVYEMAHRIKVNSRRLFRIIEKFITLSDLICLSEKNKKDDLIRNDNVADAANAVKAVALVKAKEFNRRDDLIFDLCDSCVFIGEEYLEKLVSEIMENALKFSLEGTPVEVKSEIKNNVYSISIKDYGIGMTADQISRINAFMQFGREIYHQDGNGLGLIIAKKIAELYGGNFEIRSERSFYTSVTISLKTIRINNIDLNR